MLLAAPGGEGSKPRHEEVESRVRSHVLDKLGHVVVNLAGEAEAAGDSRHGQGDQVVEVSEGWIGELQMAEADVVQGLVVDAEGSVGVLDQIFEAQGCAVGLDDSVRNLGRGNNGVGGHHPPGILLT